MPLRTKKKPVKKKPARKPTKPVEVVAAKTVLVLRTCDKDLKSYGDFQWPASGPVAAPDFKPTKMCGHGLHGWLWGSGDWSLKSKGDDIRWLVVEVVESTLINLGGKVKFPECTVVANYGHWREGMAFIRARLERDGNADIEAVAAKEKEYASATGYSGHASATGDYGHASATGDSGHASATGYSGHASATGDSGHASATGYSGHASATGYSGHASATGDYGHASATGDYGHASATGDYGHASATGDYGHASATGYSGHASATGYYGHASATGYSGHASATGYYGHASATGDYGVAFGRIRSRAGSNGLVIVEWWDEQKNRPRVTVGYVGENGIKENTWYGIDSAGQLVELK